MFGLVSDREDQTELTEHLADLLELAEYATDKDSEAFLRERIGKIVGGVAILRIGDAVPSRMDSRIAVAKETAKSLRRALRDGILPGGGVASTGLSRRAGSRRLTLLATAMRALPSVCCCEHWSSRSARYAITPASTRPSSPTYMASLTDMESTSAAALLSTYWKPA